MTTLGGSHPSLENGRVCPFLGMTDDAQTALAFPSNWNCCYHCKPHRSVQLEHQRVYCLSRNYKNCAAYRQAPNHALPREFRNRSLARIRMGDRIWKFAMALIFSVLLILPGYFFADQIGAFLKTDVLEPLVEPFSYPAAVAVSTGPTLESAPSATPGVPSSTPTATRSITFFSDGPRLATAAALEVTPTITRIPHDMGTLIGINYLFKIHRVIRGENLDLLAYVNGTTTAAIIAVNYQLAIPLRVHQIMVIPVNQTDVSDLPLFEPYRVTEDTTTEILAEQLGVDADLLQYYNGLGTSVQLLADDWIVVPREK